MNESKDLALIDPNEPVVVVNATPIVLEPGEIIYGDRPKLGNHGTGYYRLLEAHDREDYRDRGYDVGTLVYVYDGNEALHVFVNDMEFTFKKDNDDHMEEFERAFEFIPNGAEERQKQIGTLMEEINGLDMNLSTTKTALGEFKPHVGDTGNLEGSTSLVPRQTGMAETKLAVANTRNAVLKTQKTLIAKTNQLKTLMTEQSRALAIKVKEIQALAEKAQEAIWTINLYLGKEEEIVQLVKGAPAPAEQPITIRQEARFMDEECGVYAAADGIDFRNIGKFDDWLIAHPKNLQQVLPENKGIAALHVRRKAMDYKDPWLNKDLNEANLRWTYLLIRNGENVYRVFIDLEVGKHLFPTRREFEDMFWYWDEKAGEKVPLKPGSKEWNNAMDHSELRQKHYMRVLLVLQGLIDRTKIFHPMPVDRINLSDPRHCEEWLNLIYEIENVITDGKPNFDEWQYEINQQLDVGCRVIGVFDYRSKIRGNKDRDGYGDDSRIYPPNAKNPESDRLYTIEERDGDKYIFRYKRTGERVYDRWNYKPHEPQVRARCWVEKDDDFILNFDAATLERLEYYQTHKLSREFYAKMLPILEIAIALKKEEAETEAPFRLMLIGQIMQRYGVGNEEAEGKVDELIKWWKFKNRQHRALVGENDSQAVKMILDEFGHRRKQESIRAGVETIRDLIVRVVGGQTPEPVMIAHKKDNHYVAYVPHNDQNVWVTEQTWAHNRQTGEVKLKEAKPWKLVDKRHERWEILYKADRWAEWKLNPSMSQVLTDPEIESLIEQAIIKKGGFQEDYKARKIERGDENAGRMRFLPLAALVNDEYQIDLWYSGQEAMIPTTLIISNRSDDPTVEKIKVKWKRTAKGVQVEPYFGDGGQYNTFLAPGKRWETSEKRVVKLWPENIEAVYQEQLAERAHRQRVEELKWFYGHVSTLVEKEMYNRELVKARREFDADHGDPELWEDHLASLKLVRRHPQGLDKALHLILERGINPEGWSLQQVYDEATKYGLLANENDDYWQRRDKMTKLPSDVPMDFVVPAPRPPKTEKPDDEYDD